MSGEQKFMELFEKAGFLDILKDYARQREADGCEGCAYMDCEPWKMPCMSCRRNCKDYWKKGVEG